MNKRKADSVAKLLDAVADATPPADAGPGHNAAAFADEQLLGFVQRVEQVEEEIRASNNDKKVIYAEAKSMGFHVPTLKTVIAERRMDKAAFAERQAMLDLYRQRLAEAEDR